MQTTPRGSAPSSEAGWQDGGTLPDEGKGDEAAALAAGRLVAGGRVGVGWAWWRVVPLTGRRKTKKRRKSSPR